VPKKLVLPRENLYRAVHMIPTAAKGRRQAARATEQGDGRTLELQWSVTDVWTEIDSWYEGNFMERLAPGFAKKTIAENQAQMRIMLQHGGDPQVGQKPIASLVLVEENDIGGYSEGRLLDGLDPLIVSGLRAGQYGASFRFRVMVDEINAEPDPSDYNPKGLPERTIKEAAVSEFGPVTWGAYAEASAGVRSLTDEMQFGLLRDMPPERLGELAAFWQRGTRTDSDDMGMLAQMIAHGSAYISEQDDGADCVPVMKGVLVTLNDLMNDEATEPEEDDETNSSAPAGAGRDAVPVKAPARTTPSTVSDFLTYRKDRPSWLL
jgi:hypothetical protein